VNCWCRECLTAAQRNYRRLGSAKERARIQQNVSRETFDDIEASYLASAVADLSDEFARATA
jgi:hypothetical protein